MNIREFARPLTSTVLNENLAARFGKKINLNKNGVIIVCNLNRIVIGLATDGDIREALLTGKTIDDQISSIINRNFI